MWQHASMRAAEEGDPTTRSRRSHARRLLGPSLLIGAALLVGLSWAAASPTASSPDDDYHLSSIWCAWGREASQCEVLSEPPAPDPLVVSVPPLSQHMSDCHVFKLDASAECIFLREDGSYGDVPPRAWPSRADNGWYPGGFYTAMRLLVTPDTGVSLTAIRVVGVLLVIALLGGAAALLRSVERERTLLYVLTALVPLGLFVIASSNPSGPAVTGVAAGFVAAFAVLRGLPGWRGPVGAGLAAVAMLVACASRADSVYYCGLSLALAFLAARAWRTQPRRRTVALIAPAATVVLVAFFMGRQRSLGASEMLGLDPTLPGSPGLFANLTQLPMLYLGEFATKLGWMDTPMPALVTGLLALGLGLILAVGVRVLGPSRAAAAALLGAALVLVPLYGLETAGAPVGQSLQARYLLPMVLMAAALAALDPAVGRSTISRSQALVLALLVVPAHALALHTLMRRYITGLDVASWRLGLGAEWWWDIPLSPTVVWLLGSCAFAALAVALAWRASDEQSPLVRSARADERAISRVWPGCRARGPAPTG